MGPNPGGFGSNWAAIKTPYVIKIIHTYTYIIERFSKNRQEEENTITFRLKCIVVA